MISRKRFVSKLREAGYTFKTRCQSAKNELYRKTGGTHCVFVPRSDILSVPYVVSTLRQCQVPDDEIRQFLEDNV